MCVPLREGHHKGGVDSSLNFFLSFFFSQPREGKRLGSSWKRLPQEDCQEMQKRICNKKLINSVLNISRTTQNQLQDYFFLAAYLFLFCLVVLSSWRSKWEGIGMRIRCKRTKVCCKHSIVIFDPRALKSEPKLKMWIIEDQRWPCSTWSWTKYTKGARPWTRTP